MALYISYFPALLQGPIDRYEDLADQLFAEHKFDYQRMTFGLQRMLWGFIKKLVIADRVGVIVNEVIGNYAQKGYVGFTLFFAMAIYAFEVYADFSGGIDVVCGLSEIFGICVFGSCLAAEYYNAPEKTAEVFVQNPTVTGYSGLMYRTGDLARYDGEGNLVFISRKDSQVKHGGRRVELGEIETAFQAVDSIKAVCCVHARKEDKLVLYYIGEKTEKEMSLTVRDSLPKYMIPAVYHKVDELPILPNGKLDRKMLDNWANEGKDGDGS